MKPEPQQLRKRPVHEIQRLLPRHHRILELTLEGLDQVAIAQAIGMTREAIGLIQKSPMFQDTLARRRAEREQDIDETNTLDLSHAKGVIEKAAVDAAETQVSLLQSDDERVRLKSSENILDRVFGKAAGAQPSSGAGVTINAEGLKVLQIALVESQNKTKELKEIIDA